MAEWGKIRPVKRWIGMIKLISWISIMVILWSGFFIKAQAAVSPLFYIAQSEKSKIVQLEKSNYFQLEKSGIVQSEKSKISKSEKNEISQPEKMETEDMEEWSEELFQQMKEQISFDEIEQSIQNSSLKGEYSFSQIVSSLMKGDVNQGMNQLIAILTDCFLEEIKLSRKNFAQIFLIAILAALFTNIASGFSASALQETGFFVAYLSMTGLVLSSFFLMFSITNQVLSDVLRFMEALIPAYALAVTMVSGSASSIAIYEMTLLLIRGCQWLLLKLLLPLIEGYMLIGIANYVGENDRFSYLGNLIKRGSQHFLKWSVGLVVGLNLIQNMILPAVDAVKSGIWQKGLSAIPGAGPIIQTVAGTLIGSGVLLKNSIGAGGLILLLLLCAVPFLKLLLLTAAFYISAAMLQPISDKRLISLLHTAGESGQLFLQAVITCCTLFFITVALAAVSTNMRYYAG